MGFSGSFRKGLKEKLQRVIHRMNAGLVVGGAWFLGNISFQHYHNGQSITEYYLDK